MEFTIKKLTDADIPAMLKLCQGNPLYYEHMKIQPTPENLKESMTALPAGKTVADKYFVGFYDGDRLAAILDLIMHFPNSQTAFIGWFITEKEYQGKGMGTVLVTGILQELKKRGVCKVRLGYIKTNPQSQRFWEKNGFIPTGVESQEEYYTVVILEKLL